MLRAPSRSPLVQLIARLLIVALVAAAIPTDTIASLPVGEASKLTKSAFGELLAHTGSDPQPYAFTGEPYDPNVGFQYHRARWMDPRVGRLVGMDPFYGFEKDPFSLHRYVYAAASPVMVVDPSGAISSRIYGMEVHAKIGLHFVQSSSNDRLEDRRINTILETQVAWVGWMRPDLVDRTTGEVYEIKPIGGVFMVGLSGYAEGWFQLQDYLVILNGQDPQHRTWIEGTAENYTPESTILLGGGAVAIVFPPVNGVILYEVASAPVTGVGLVAVAGALTISGTAAATASNSGQVVTRIAAALLIGLMGIF